MTNEARIYNIYKEGKTVSSINGVGKRISICKTIKLDYFHTSYTRTDSQWIEDLHVKSETIKLSEENLGSMLCDVGLGTIFLDMSPHARGKKAEISKQNLIKVKSFKTVKETINKTKRPPTEWENSNDISNNQLISKI
uniref:Uncharacterized protein n=1 Tax=Sus scrofa TaxID=9823 RepID=A0A8D1Z9E1_PIG